MINEMQLNKIKTVFQFFTGLKIPLERLHELVLARNAGSPASRLTKAEKDAGLDVLPYSAPADIKILGYFLDPKVQFNRLADQVRSSERATVGQNNLFPELTKLQVI